MRGTSQVIIVPTFMFVLSVLYTGWLEPGYFIESVSSCSHHVVFHLRPFATLPPFVWYHILHVSSHTPPQHLLPPKTRLTSAHSYTYLAFILLLEAFTSPYAFATLCITL